MIQFFIDDGEGRGGRRRMRGNWEVWGGGGAECVDGVRSVRTGKRERR